MKLPRPGVTGIYASDLAITDAPTIMQEAKPGNLAAGSWLTLSEDLQFFTPALIYLLGASWQMKLLADYNLDTGHKPTITYYQSPRPLFVGLMSPDNDVTFNYTIFAIPKTEWADFHNWVHTLLLRNAPSKTVVRFRSQNITLRDEPAWEKLSYAAIEAPDPLPIVAFGAETNRGSFYFKTARVNTNTSTAQVVYDQSLISQDLVKLAGVWDAPITGIDQ